MSRTVAFARQSITKLVALALVATALLVSQTAAAESSVKIAVIDLTRAIADTEEGIRVNAQLQELFDARQSEYEAKEKAAMDAKAEYDQLAQSGKAKQDDLRKKGIALEKMAYELQVAQQNYRREMQQKEYQLKQPIIKRMLTLVRRLASKQGYEMVLNKEAVPFFRSDLDITDRVVQMYNAAQAATPSPGKAPAPKAAPRKKSGGTSGSKGSKKRSSSRKRSRTKRSTNKK